MNLGDLVRCRMHEPGKRRPRVLTGVIVQFVGDFNVRLFCDGNEVHRPFASHCHPVGVRDECGRQVLDDTDRELWLKLLVASRSQGGKAALKRSRSRADLVLVERDGEETVESSREDDWYGVGPEGGELPAGKGAGSPNRRLPPMRLASKGNPTEWHADFAHYLGYWVDEAVGDALDWLAQTHGLLFETLYDVTDRHVTVAEIAARDGITERSVHLRLSRGRALLRDRIGTPESIERIAA